MAKKTISEIREEPGMSNAGKYKDVAKDDFCGPNGTYPVNTLKRAKSALKLAHNAGRKAGKIKACVYRKYPELKKDKGKGPTAKDVSGDGKYTKKDFLINIGVLDKEGNKVKKK
jgi:hypothetical protein